MIRDTVVVGIFEGWYGVRDSSIRGMGSDLIGMDLGRTGMVVVDCWHGDFDKRRHNALALVWRDATTTKRDLKDVYKSVLQFQVFVAVNWFYLIQNPPSNPVSRHPWSHLDIKGTLALRILAFPRFRNSDQISHDLKMMRNLSSPARIRERN